MMRHEQRLLESHASSEEKLQTSELFRISERKIDKEIIKIKKIYIKYQS